MSNPNTAEWDDVTSLLRERGVATLSLPGESKASHADAFLVAREALEMASTTVDDGSIPLIPEDINAAHATGYHSSRTTNNMSRYNAHREGFVFSDGRVIAINRLPQFKSTMEMFFHSLHTIATRVMSGIENSLEIKEQWFEATLGPTSTSSQWHVKRYVDDTQPSQPADSVDTARKQDDIDVLLPMHTDPSLVSVVVIDAPACQPLARGLQYFWNGEWNDIPCHGHAVAIGHEIKHALFG